jgi:tetratricopeptide (TPR) repeat protein
MMRAWWRTALATATLLAVAAAAHAEQPLDPTARLLVMPFQASSSEPKAEWLGELAASALTRELRAAGVQAIRRDDRLQAMDRLRVPSVPMLSHATVIRLASVVGATVAVVGRVESIAGDLVLRARTIRVDTGYMAPEIVERGPRDDLFVLAARIVGAMVPEAGSAASTGGAPRPPVAAFELFVRGLTATNAATKVRLLTQALERAPAFDDARFALWDVYSEQGEHQRALTVVRGVGDASPEAQRAAFLAAVSDLQLGRYPDASAELDALHRAMPEAAFVNDMGIAQLRKPGPGAKATDLFRQATTLDPNDADLFFNLGYAHWISREYPQAVTALREAVRRDPADEDAHYVLGAALQAAGAPDEAAREKDLARRLSSVYAALETRRTPASVPRGLERVKTTIDASSLARVESALSAAGQREQRELVGFYLANGRRLFQNDRDEEALAELRRAVFLSPYDAEAHLLMGRILLRGGRAREAIDALKISIWSQDSVPARLALAEAYSAAHDYASARGELQAVLALDAGNATAAARLAELPAATPR